MKVTFTGQPSNYAKIDATVSRSAQPQKDDFKWLKEQGVTDIVNFRTMYAPDIDFDEKAIAESYNIKYHNIPSYTREPKPENIWKFLELVENIKKDNGKVHIHCKAGADRTGMYALIYKQYNGIGNLASNIQEMLKMGHHKAIYPNLIDWIKNFVK